MQGICETQRHDILAREQEIETLTKGGDETASFPIVFHVHNEFRLKFEAMFQFWFHFQYVLRSVQSLIFAIEPANGNDIFLPLIIF